MNTMEQQTRKLRLILKVFPVDFFYSINVTETAISLQGKYRADKVLFFKNKYHANPTITTGGYVEFERHNVRVVLTD